ncbi:C-_U-editing enzyme APOBEC-1 [Monodelphis domestica]|uniref:C->U-editing enzyme APOBEC-1 n=1 Tax=Monodelphis domestica TaxID=13616 RepID=ABEC1_MONDO|nr:C->U-editing enzyme APOBEC-1 [Monodelphis domestica]Q9TUI7.1 RecName: Full=C->U-editing enzyme APOBEC-1; AltName: Full=Apolipoprotein B mRNA-editing enzyme catalytic polypeptide 1; Short=APOBEC-1; Short=Apolipoprotein B mRNA-editing enzyme 1; AltName: Full=mRNA(cytosine(6666)) deaminase 1 [Monodelphis domestica]BAA86051.1 apolipoprotein B mRNA editing enzyme complex-1 (APOBEC-1) [Monodelphis domestica]
MNSKTGPSVGDATLRRRIKPWEFVAFFNPQELRKETCLLYEIKWGNQNIWRHSNQNTSQHAEINFMEKFTAERHFNSSVRCSITWFLSWSPCWECSKAIRKFLDHYPNVTLAIFISRLYWHMDQQHRQGLKELVHSGVTIQIMSYSEYHYCWRNFVDYPQGEEDYWPKYPYLWIMLYVLELHCIILGLPPCLKISGSHSNQLALFSLDLQDCHYQKIPYNVLVATGLVQPFVTWR